MFFCFDFLALSVPWYSARRLPTETGLRGPVDGGGSTWGGVSTSMMSTGKVSSVSKARDEGTEGASAGRAVSGRPATVKTKVRVTRLFQSSQCQISNVFGDEYPTTALATSLVPERGSGGGVDNVARNASFFSRVLTNLHREHLNTQVASSRDSSCV